ncbi:hypothetical protein [Scytonema sp. NUACC26]|uniref:hypothetical protein n=1 Tax=Scytonema sp. NUACC26 TaxID=3140176 RepID=UPI0034DC2311
MTPLFSLLRDSDRIGDPKGNTDGCKIWFQSCHRRSDRIGDPKGNTDGVFQTGFHFGGDRVCAGMLKTM